MPCGRSVPPPITAPRGDGAVSEDDGAVRKQESAPEISTAVGEAVVLLALAGICALLASHLLIGALRLTAGVLAGQAWGCWSCRSPADGCPGSAAVCWPQPSPCWSRRP